MSESTDEPSGKPTVSSPRKLSQFLFQEMLYDYLSDQLDERRRSAVEDHIGLHPECKEEATNLKKTMDYCDGLADTELSESLSQRLQEPRGFEKFVEQLMDWKSWPESMKWFSQAAVISLFVAVVSLALPWDKIEQLLPGVRHQVLVEADRAETVPPGHTQPAETSDIQPEKPEQALEKSASQPKETANAGTAAEVSTVIGKAKPELPTDKTQKASDKGKAASAKQLVTKAADQPVAKGPRGELYRLYMEMENIDGVTPLVVAELEKLGAVKSGEVELGWRKPKGSYFHFSISEDNYEPLLKALRYFGPVRIYREAHWRVMPEGKKRFILWVKDSNL